MKTISKIAAACALVCAGTQVQAATPATPFTAPDLTIYLSGASAPQGFLTTLAGQLFDAGFYTYHNDNGTTITTDDGVLYRAFYGTTKTNLGLPAALSGKNILIINRAKGGSVWGVNAVARNEAIATMPITATNCPVLAGGIYRCAEKGLDPGVVGYPNGDEQVPDFGVSDVEPKIFLDALNVEFGFSPLNAAEAARLTSSPVNILMMGLPITNNVANFYLSRALYGAALAGTVTTWNGAGSMGAAAAPAGGNDIVVCRRVPGSGTQAAYNWYFGNVPCGTSAVPATQDDTAVLTGVGVGTPADPIEIDNTTGYIVLENSASGDVRNCLNKAVNGGVHTFISKDLKTYKYDFGTGGRGALGVLSVDSITNSSPQSWTFRTFDGAGSLAHNTQSPVIGTGLAPTKANLLAGNYEFAVELTMQYRNSNSSNPLVGNKKTFIDFFIARAGQSAFNTGVAVAGLPGSVNACGTANTTKAFRAGDTCGNFSQVCQ